MKEFEVLIVDDDDIVLFIQETNVKITGLDSSPTLHVNGRVALNYLKENDHPQKKFLILLDINMPEMNGWEMLDALSEEKLKGAIYVIIVTSSINENDRKKALTYSHVIEYFIKPLDSDSVETIKQLPQIKCLI